MDYQILISFFTAALLLALSPGPDNLFVLAQSLTHGKGKGIAVVLGLVSGCLVHTTLLAFGVSALINANPVFLRGITLFGVVYLLYLSWKVYKGPAGLAIDGNLPVKSNKALFAQGFLMNVLNPKVTLFFLAFFPGFLFSDSLSHPVQFYVLGGLFMLAAFLVFGTLAVLAGRIAQYLKHHASAEVVLKYVQIIVFVGIALYLLLSMK